MGKTPLGSTRPRDDLMQHRGRALVHAGREQPVEVHLLAHAINGALGSFGATIRLIEPVAVSPASQQHSLQQLVADMAAGKVDTLLMLGTNPVYSAPAELDFAGALRRVPVVGEPRPLCRRDRDRQHLAHSAGA